MSVFEKTSLACPACGSTVVVDLVHSVNAVRRPDLRTAILDRSFQRTVCPACGAGFRVEPKFTYLDTGREAVHRRHARRASCPPGRRPRRAPQASFDKAFGKASGASGAGRGMQARCVFGWLGLNEKLIALEHGIDDVALEMAKLATLRTIGNVKLGIDREFRLVGATADTLVLGWLRTRSEEIDEEYSVPRQILKDIEDCAGHLGGAARRRLRRRCSSTTAARCSAFPPELDTTAPFLLRRPSMPNLLSLLGLKPVPVLETTAPDDARARGDDDVVVAPEASPGTTARPRRPAPVVAGDEAEPAKAGDKAAVPPEKAAYDKELAAVTKLRTDLGKHKQAGHVKDKTDHADAAIAQAATHAATPDWPAAMTELASAKTALVDGKGFADKFADFLVKRAEANLLFTAAQTSGWTLPGWMTTQLATADGNAGPPTRDYVTAKADCQKLIDGLGPVFKKSYVDDVKPKIAALKTLPAAKFIKAETDELDKLLLQQQAAITAKQWRQVQAQRRPGPGQHPHGVEDRRPA